MKTAQFLAIWLLISFSAHLIAADPPTTYAAYRRDIQRAFASEVMKKHVAALSQSARMLGILEFMDQSKFDKFYECMQKYPAWDNLPPENRERAVESCQISARYEAASGPAPASAQKTEEGVAKPSAVEMRVMEILGRLSDIDQKLTSLQDNQRQIQESLVSRQQETYQRRRPAASSELPLEDEELRE